MVKSRGYPNLRIAEVMVENVADKERQNWWNETLDNIHRTVDGTEEEKMRPMHQMDNNIYTGNAWVRCREQYQVASIGTVNIDGS